MTKIIDDNEVITCKIKQNIGEKPMPTNYYNCDKKVRERAKAIIADVIGRL